jgi:hypothetical protein
MEHFASSEVSMIASRPLRRATRDGTQDEDRLNRLVTATGGRPPNEVKNANRDSSIVRSLRRRQCLFLFAHTTYEQFDLLMLRVDFPFQAQYILFQILYPIESCPEFCIGSHKDRYDAHELCPQCGAEGKFVASQLY